MERPSWRKSCQTQTGKRGDKLRLPKWRLTSGERSGGKKKEKKKKERKRNERHLPPATCHLLPPAQPSMESL